jgi:hypothetical protein
VEFAREPSRIKWVTKYENLIVLRTFSKRAGKKRYISCSLVSTFIWISFEIQNFTSQLVAPVISGHSNVESLLSFF